MSWCLWVEDYRLVFHILIKGENMNDKLKNVLKYKYKAEIEDAKYKIKCYSDQELIIPEHPDITGEVDKLLSVMAEAEDKMAVIEQHYGKNKAE
jgi:hypothetical protein